MSEIMVYRSHIEVYPYEAGDCPMIEKMMSRYNATEYKYVPIAYYISDHILYLPRGISLSLLENYFHTTPTIVQDADPYFKISKGKGLLPAKSKIQEEAIRFLCCEKEFGYAGIYPQFGLNLDTGDGKTYATVYSILKLKIRAIIITHQEKIKKQWIKTLEEKTSFPIENLVNIDGSKTMDEIMDGKLSGEIYLCNHQTLHAYASNHGWSTIRKFFQKIHVGIKVLDESHKFFTNAFMLDNYSNVYRTIYLTATFGRSDRKELAIYKKAYASMVRFGEQTLSYKEKRKHINFIVVYFQSHPEYWMTPSVRTGYGFSSYKYIEYELTQDTKRTLERVLLKILEMTKKLEGRTLILSPKIETANLIETIVKDNTDYEVGTVHSKKSEEEVAVNIKKQVVSSTIKSIGEGADLVGLRVLINLEPISSPLLASQVCGRLREYSDTDDTYLFYPVDLTIPDSTRLLKQILPVMKKKCKQIIYTNMEF